MAVQVTIGCPKEIHPREKRVAITPESAAIYIQMGYTVLLESNAGVQAAIANTAYARAGVKIVENAEAVYQADLVLKVRPVTVDEAQLLRRGAVIMSFGSPEENNELLSVFMDREITALAADRIPSMPNTQSFDVQTSLASLAGYRAVIEASHLFGRFLGGQMTAAGLIQPAKVLIIGADTAGLSAATTAKKMGAIVNVYDSRPSYIEVAKKLGVELLDLQGMELKHKDRWAEQRATNPLCDAESHLLRNYLRESDIVITSVVDSGIKKAPTIITNDMIPMLNPGSVVVDLAAAYGGNVEMTLEDECIMSSNRVHIVGYRDLSNLLPAHASRLYAQNLCKLIQTFAAGNTLKLDFSDAVLRHIVIACGGQLFWPACSDVQSLETITARSKVSTASDYCLEVDHRSAYLLTERRKTFASALSITIGLLLILSLNILSHNPMLLTLLVVFALAGVAAYLTVWSVNQCLYTPLIVLSNVFAGIAVVAGLQLLSAAKSDLSFLLGGAVVGASFVVIMSGFRVAEKLVFIFTNQEVWNEHSKLYYRIPTIAAIVVQIICTWTLGIDVSELAYLSSAICCIVAVAGLSNERSAIAGIELGKAGISISVFATLGIIHYTIKSVTLGALVIILGSIFGHVLGTSVSITGIPQFMAFTNALFGSCLMMAGIGLFDAHPYDQTSYTMAFGISIQIAVFVGGICFAAGCIAFAKLRGLTKSTPLSLIGKNYISLIIFVIQIVVAVLFVCPYASNPDKAALVSATNSNTIYGLTLLNASCLLAVLLGWHISASLGARDLPISMTTISALAGWGQVALGFMLDNLMLVIVGALATSIGSTMTYFLCSSVKRNLSNILLGVHDDEALEISKTPCRVKVSSVEEIHDRLLCCKNVMIVPGFSMAVGRAQHAVATLSKFLAAQGIQVTFAVHPMSGRLPGHLYAILADAGVPLEWTRTVEEANAEMASVDMVLTIGGSDITNSAAEEIPWCAIAGRSVLRVWKAKTCIYLKRSLDIYKADVPNPVLHKENTLVLLGDARKNLEALLSMLRSTCDV